MSRRPVPPPPNLEPELRGLWYGALAVLERNAMPWPARSWLLRAWAGPEPDDQAGAA